MKAAAVLNSFKKRFGPKIKGARIEKRVHKLKESNAICRIWFSVDRASFKDAVRHLCDIYPDPHFSVASGYQIGNGIELIYHFTLNYATKLGEIAVSIRVKLPRSDPVLPTITDLIPGAQISERELQEMLGVRIEGTPDSRRLFLDPDFPKGVYPWRRDETGPDKLVRNLHEGGE
jgi:membrane-bound hydrogenase subunit beta